MREQFYEQHAYCVMCRNPIPPDRLRYKSITCSDECKKNRKRSLYVRMSQVQCMFCRKPTTRADQTLFRRFRKWAEANPKEAFPAEYKLWESLPLSDETKEGIRYRTYKDEFNFKTAMLMLEASLAEKDQKNGETGVQAHTEVGSAGKEGPEVQDSPQ